MVESARFDHRARPVGRVFGAPAFVFISSGGAGRREGGMWSVVNVILIAFIALVSVLVRAWISPPRCIDHQRAGEGVPMVAREY
jgi:hypothetical protein